MEEDRSGKRGQRSGEEEHRDGKGGGGGDVWKREAQKEKKREETRQWQNSCCHFSRLRPQARLGYSCCGCLCSASNKDLTAGQAASAAPPPHAQGLGPVRHAPGPGPQGPSAQGWRLFAPWPPPACKTQKKGSALCATAAQLLPLIGSNDLRTRWSSN